MTQKERLLSILLRTPNEWVDVWTIITQSHICHYTSVIKLLREKGNIIENKKEWVTNSFGENICHSWYRLVIPTPTGKKTIKEKILNFIKEL